MRAQWSSTVAAADAATAASGGWLDEGAGEKSGARAVRAGQHARRVPQ